MTAPLVSIIIPCYNSETFVADAIESALAQTQDHVEVIVVDDGSTDTTWDIVQGYGDRVRAVQQPNSGAPVARNTGLLLARGSFVQFLDADDELLPTKVEVCLQHFDMGKDVVFCNHIDEDAQHRRGGSSLQRLLYGFQRPVPAWDPTDIPASVLLRPVNTIAPLIRSKTIRDAGGWDETLSNNQDIELGFRLAIKGARFKKIDATLARVRYHESVSRIRFRPDSHRGVLRATRIMYDQANAAGVLTPKLKRALANRYAKYGRLAYQHGDRALARDAFECANQLSDRPDPTAFPLYNAASHLLGLERMERWVRAAKRLARS